MTSALAWRASITIGFLAASGLCSTACGSSSSSASGDAAGNSSSNGGSAGSTSSTGTSGAANGSGQAGSATGGASSAGSSSSNGGSSSVGASGSGGGTNGNGGAPAAAGTGGSGGAAGKSGSSGGSGGSGGGAAVDCSTMDPLKTNNTKTDAYDCTVIQVSAKWGMPDPMIVKSQIQQESSFNIFAISGDSPCGIMTGWTDAESKSFGLIQTTPACGEAKSALLPNGHPNLDQDMTVALWATSVFNPTINLDEGVKTDVDGMKSLMKTYPGCTAVQYNMMAAGAFNSGTNAVTGCGMYNARAQMYVDAITTHYKKFAAVAGWPDPY